MNTREFWWVRICTLILVSAVCAELGAASAYLPRGVFVTIGLEQLTSKSGSSLMGKDYLSGFIIERDWDSIERDHNIYEWAELDDVVAAVEDSGKQLILGIYPGLTGSGLPSWYSGETHSCQSDSPATIGPIPWDTQFHGEILGVIVQMVRRFDGSPAIAGYQVSGFHQWSTMDFYLCTASQVDRDTWINSDGYTRQEVMDAFLSIVAAVQAETQKPLLIPIANMLDETRGTLNTETTKAFIIIPFYEQAPVQAGIGRTIFTHKTADPLQIWNRGTISSQFKLLLERSPNIWGGREIETKGGPRTPAEFERMFDIALHYGVSLFVIGFVQALETGNVSAMRCMNNALLNGGGHCGH